MLKLCSDVLSNETTKMLCTRIFEGIVEWYKKMQQEYSSKLRQEMYRNIEEFEKKWVDTLASQIEEINFDLSYQFNTKLSFFSVADALEKIILCRYSSAPDTDFCLKYGVNKHVLGGELNKQWLKSKLNDVQMIELVAKVLADENEKPLFDLSALHEDRAVRSRGTHVAFFESCMSALRCYNTIREIIAFLDPDLDTQLLKFDYPKNDRFDIDDFISRSRFSFDKYTTILVTESLHDVPAQYLATVANLGWDIVVDYDGYSQEYGFATNVNHVNIQYQLVTSPNSIPSNDNINHSYTRWFRCGDYQVRSTGLFRYKDRATGSAVNSTFITGRTPYCNNYASLDSQDIDIAKRIIEFAYNSERPLNIIILSNNNHFVKYIVHNCINYDPDLNFFCTWIGFGQLPNDIYFNQYDIEENKKLQCEHIAHYNCSYVRFFEKISDCIKSLGWQSRYSEVKEFRLPTEKMPDGKQISENDRNALNHFFEVLYLGAEYESTKIKQDIDNFYCGGKASWSVIASNEAIMLSDRTDDFIDKIKSSMGISQQDTGKQIFFVKHAAGQGGTTLARQIAWKLHKQYPVLELKRAPCNDFQILLQNFYDRIIDSSPFIILCDDSETYLNDLISWVPRIQRRFSVIVSVRENNSLIKLVKNATYLPFSTLNEDMITSLQIKFRSNSQLSADILQEKDRNFNIALSDKKPFFIGLYYKEKDFDIESYVKKTFINAPDSRYRKMLACIAMCDIMGYKFVPVLLIRKMLGLSLRTEALDQYPDAESLIIRTDEGTPKYSFRHCLLAEEYLKLYKDNESKSIPDVYFNLAEELIKSGAEACGNNPSVPILDLLTSVIIQYREGTDDSTSIKLSKFLNSLGTPQQRISILDNLGNAFEEYARSFLASDNYNTNESHKKTIQLVSHTYAHLGRIYSRTPLSNYKKAAEYLGYARSFMIGNDPDIYHMEGTALHEQLKYKLEYFRDNPCENDDETLSLFERILELYDYTTHYNSPEYGISSKLELCKDMLNYVCEKKNVKNRNDISKLSTQQQEIYSCFMEALHEVDAYGIEDNPIAENRVHRCKEWLNSGQIFGNYSEAVAYFQQQYDQCNKEDSYSTNRSLLYLTYAQINHFRNKYNTYAFHRSLDKAKAVTMLLNIKQLLETPYLKDSSTEYFRRTRLFSEWFQIAKATDQPIWDCIKQAQAWLAMEEEYTSARKCKCNPEPWYYLMVFYYLDALEGGTTSVKEALKYQKEMNNDAKFEPDRIHGRNFFQDILVEGKGAGQLLSVRHCRNEETILIESAIRNLSPKIVKGNFQSIASGAGEMHLFYPMQWNNVYVHVRYGKTYQNSLNNQLHEHKLESPIGFTFFRPHALSEYVKDNSANEHLELSSIMRDLKRKVQTENKTEKRSFKKKPYRRK